LRLKGIGRVRARKMFSHGFKTLGDVRKADLGSLGQLIGKAVAQAVKEQLDSAEDEPISENKRKGQMSIGKYE
jgi:helicase